MKTKCKMLEKNPMVITAGKLGKYEQKPYKGDLCRVFPVTAQEVLFLQMLQHQHDKFAPASGSGVMITPEAFEKFCAV